MLDAVVSGCLPTLIDVMKRLLHLVVRESMTGPVQGSALVLGMWSFGVGLPCSRQSSQKRVPAKLILSPAFTHF